MKYHVIPPPVHLAEYIRFFWILEDEQPYIHRSLADGGVEMIFHYKGTFDEVQPGGMLPTAISAVRGPSSSYHIYACQKTFGIFGVYFYPFAIPALFGMPASELSDEMPDLSTFMGSEGRELEEQMMIARTNSSRVKIISTFLEERIAKRIYPSDDINSVINSIIHTNGKLNIDQLAERCFLSRRQFERRFKLLAGFSPKMYARIIRFQHAADEYNNRNRSLAQLALSCGYYDQSHFSNDFKKFSGYNPKDYFSGKAIGNEWREAADEMSQFSKI